MSEKRVRRARLPGMAAIGCGCGLWLLAALGMLWFLAATDVGFAYLGRADGMERDWGWLEPALAVLVLAGTLLMVTGALVVYISQRDR